LRSWHCCAACCLLDSPETRARYGMRTMDTGTIQSCHIVIDKVGKYFANENGGLWALRDLSLCVRRGEFLCVVGPSGCGKTTLLSLVAGFDTPTEGQVYCSGQPVTGPGPDRGVIFQEDALFPWLSVAGNVCYALHRRGIPRRQATQQAMHFLELVGLQEFAAYFPGQLSGGMKQRAALARVLANRPQALLMDEPFGALDALSRMEMQQLLLTIWRELAPTILFVTHDVDEAIFLADRVYVMTARPGRICRQLQVPLPRPRTAEVLTSQGLMDIKHEVLNLLLEANAQAHSRQRIVNPL